MNTFRKLIPYLFLLLLNIFLVWGVDLFTFKYRPGYGISGNGNPGILVLVAAYICFFLLLVVTFFKSTSFFQKSTNHASQLLIPLLAMPSAHLHDPGRNPHHSNAKRAPSWIYAWWTIRRVPLWLFESIHQYAILQYLYPPGRHMLILLIKLDHSED